MPRWILSFFWGRSGGAGSLSAIFEEETKESEKKTSQTNFGVFWNLHGLMCLISFGFGEKPDENDKQADFLKPRKRRGFLFSHFWGESEENQKKTSKKAFFGTHMVWCVLYLTVFARKAKTKWKASCFFWNIGSGAGSVLALLEGEMKKIKKKTTKTNFGVLWNLRSLMRFVSNDSREKGEKIWKASSVFVFVSAMAAWVFF